MTKKERIAQYAAYLLRLSSPEQANRLAREGTEDLHLGEFLWASLDVQPLELNRELHKLHVKFPSIRSAAIDLIAAELGTETTLWATVSSPNAATAKVQAATDIRKLFAKNDDLSAAGGSSWTHDHNDCAQGFTAEYAVIYLSAVDAKALEEAVAIARTNGYRVFV